MQDGGSNNYELAKLAMSVFGAVVGGVTVGGRIVGALIAREANVIERKVLQTLAPQFVSREVIETKQGEVSRRLERIEEQLDLLLGRTKR